MTIEVADAMEAQGDGRRNSEQQAQYERCYWRAFDMLQHEFMRGLEAGPHSQVATPHDNLNDTRTLASLVAEQLDHDVDGHALGQLLQIAWRAALDGHHDAQHLVERMARTHAAYYTSLMSENGDLAE